jgi:hypothetical protein
MRRLRKCLGIVATGLVLMLASASMAFAQPYPGGGETPPDVGGRDFFPPGGDDIPRTGSNLLLFILIALLALLAGLALRRATRRTARIDG